MRKLMCLLYFLIPYSLLAVNDSLDRIKDEILVVLKKTGDVNDEYSVNNLPNQIIIDKKNNIPIADGVKGIFTIPRFYAHGCEHYLLVDDNGFQILNMRKPLVCNLKILLGFLNTNEKYDKMDIFFYILNFLDTYTTNQRLINEEGIRLKE